MPSFFRNAGFATLAAVAGIAAVFADPLSASEADLAPAISYTEHGEAGFSGDFGMDTLANETQLAHDVDFSTPVATHAVAAGESESLPLVADSEGGEGERNGRTLAELVGDYAASQAPDAEATCLANAIYYESKSESLTGQLTVAEVIINRARSGRFPSSLCGVVRQPSQFSFVRRGNIPQAPRASAQWRTAVAIARIAMDDLADGAAPRALFFHARHVSPSWRKLTRVATVGNHVFYR